MIENKIKHIAIILDGNKRWAKKNNYSLQNGYKKGLQNINQTINYCLELKIKYLTLFTLSSENLKRSNISNIFQVIYDEFNNFVDHIVNEKKVKLKIIGSRNNLPKKIIELISFAENKTSLNNHLDLNLAFNYGFKDELKQVFKKFNESYQSIDLNNESDLNKLFFLGDIPDPDILIRTGGEKRLSNFIMYNLTYTELFFLEKLWPEFNKNDFTNIIETFKMISRRYGL